MSVREFISGYTAGFISVIDGLDAGAIENAAEQIRLAFEDGRRIFVAGNGGSAATASHMACDFAKTTLGKAQTLPAKRMKAIALTDNVPLITAWGNDVRYDAVFSEQLRNLAEAGDVLIAISASGNSPNILDVLKTAREMGLRTIGLYGFDGGKAAAMTDFSVIVRSAHFGYIEDAHSVINHLITDHLKQFVQA